MAETEQKNIWDNSVPVEKSAYLVESLQYINYESLQHNPEKYQMIDLFCGAGGFASRSNCLRCTKKSVSH